MRYEVVEKRRCWGLLRTWEIQRLSGEIVMSHIRNEREAYDYATLLLIETLGARSTGKRNLIEIERETDGRWIAEIPALPGVMAYEVKKEDAIRKVKELAHKVIDEMEVKEIN